MTMTQASLGRKILTQATNINTLMMTYEVGTPNHKALTTNQSTGNASKENRISEATANP